MNRTAVCVTLSLCVSNPPRSAAYSAPPAPPPGLAVAPKMWKKTEQSRSAYSMPGAYRPMVLRPALESWARMQYDDVTLPLTLSDSDALAGKAAPVSLPEGKLAALKLVFTLPSGTYATMCLRELTKQSTHLSTQQKLNDAANAKVVGTPAAAEEEAPAPAPAPAAVPVPAPAPVPEVVAAAPVAAPAAAAAGEEK